MKLLLIALTLTSLTAQEWVINYLGGVRTGPVTLDAPAPERGALAVSPDGHWLFLTQAATGAVLRYDLRARTVQSFAVAGLADATVGFSVTQVISGAVANDDGTLLLPLGGQVVRLEADGRLTANPFPFVPQGLPVRTVRAVAKILDGPTRAGITLVMGDADGAANRLWAASTVQTNTLVPFGSCPSSICDQSALAPNSPAGQYRARRLWGVAWSGTSEAYFTDPNADPGQNGAVAVLRQGLVTVLGHGGMTAIPLGPSQRRLYNPTGIVLDPAGSLIVADTGNHRILKRTAAGVWSVVAGAGPRGWKGDGGPAAQAELAEPKSIAVDAAGVLYIHDTGNGRIRRVLLNGMIENIHGASASPSVGDLQFPGVTSIAAAASGEIYLANSGRIVRVDGQGRVAPVADGAVRGPMAVDQENRLLWSETYSVRRLETDGSVATIAGTGVESFETSLRDPAPALRTPIIAYGVSSGLLIHDRGSIRRWANGELMNITGRQNCEGYADGIPAIFACTDREESDTSIAHGLDVNSAVSLADGSIAYPGNWGRSLRLIDVEGYVNTLIRTPGYQIRTLSGGGPDGRMYALLWRINSPAGLASYRLAAFSRTGQMQWLTSDSRTAASQVLRVGQRPSDWTLAEREVLASDQRGYLYTYDPLAGRVVVMGEPPVVRIASNPSGQRIVVDGVPATTPQTYRWLPGEYHSVEIQGRATTWMPKAGASEIVFGEPPPEIGRIEGAISNWGWVTIYGSNLAPETRTWEIVDGRLPQSLGGVDVTVAGQPASVAYVSAGQVNVLLPPVFTGDAVESSLRLTVGGRSVTTNVTGSATRSVVLSVAEDGLLHFTGGVLTDPPAAPGEWNPSPLPCAAGGPRAEIDGTPYATRDCFMLSPGLFRLQIVDPPAGIGAGAKVVLTSAPLSAP